MENSIVYEEFYYKAYYSEILYICYTYTQVVQFL